MPWLAAGIVGAGLLAGGGAVGGAFAAQPSTGGSSNNVIPTSDPQSDFSLNAAQLDALGRIGFFNPQVLRQAGPLARVTNAINSGSSDEKIKRRALQELARLFEAGGEGSQDRLTGEFSDAGGVERFPLELRGALARVGLSPSDLDQLFADERRFQESIAPLMELGPVQEDVVRNRLSAASDVSSIAAGLLNGQSSPTQNMFREQFVRDRTRGIDDAEETLLLRSQFGGFNPSSGLEQINEFRSDLPLDADLAALEKALLTAGGVNQLLQPGTAAAQGQAGLSTQASQGALGIAASQANVANQLRTQSELAGSAALGNGISAGASAFGDALQAGLLFGGGIGATAPGVQDVANNAVNSGAGLNFGAF